MSSLIRLDRMGSTPWGTLGTLRLPDGAEFPTIEPQWRDNAVGKSCIPAGEYPLRFRQSAIVARTSGGQFTGGWEIDDVADRNRDGKPDRDLIMIHPGNWERDTAGCVLVGRMHAVIKNRPGVTASRDAFADLMLRLNRSTSWRILIRWATPE